MECDIPTGARAAYCIEFFVPIVFAGLLSFTISVLCTLTSKILFKQPEVVTASAHLEAVVPKSAAAMIDTVLTKTYTLPGDTCSICREVFVRPMKLPCGHTGCDALSA